MDCAGEKCIIRVTGKTALENLELPDDAGIEEIYEKSIQLATPVHPQNDTSWDCEHRTGNLFQEQQREDPTTDLTFRVLMHSTYSALLSLIKQTCRHTQCRDLEYLLRDFSCLDKCLTTEKHEGHCNETFYFNILGNFHHTYKKFARKQLRQMKHYFLTPTEVREVGMFYEELVKLKEEKCDICKDGGRRKRKAHKREKVDSNTHEPLEKATMRVRDAGTSNNRTKPTMLSPNTEYEIQIEKDALVNMDMLRQLRYIKSKRELLTKDTKTVIAELHKIVHPPVKNTRPRHKLNRETTGKLKKNGKFHVKGAGDPGAKSVQPPVKNTKPRHILNGETTEKLEKDRELHVKEADDTGARMEPASGDIIDEGKTLDKIINLGTRRLIEESRKTNETGSKSQPQDVPTGLRIGQSFVIPNSFFGGNALTKTDQEPSLMTFAEMVRRAPAPAPAPAPNQAMDTQRKQRKHTEPLGKGLNGYHTGIFPAVAHNYHIPNTCLWEEESCSFTNRRKDQFAECLSTGLIKHRKVVKENAQCPHNAKPESLESHVKDAQCPATPEREATSQDRKPFRQLQNRSIPGSPSGVWPSSHMG